MRQRRLRVVPRGVLLLLAVGFASQVLWHGIRPGVRADTRELPSPPPLQSLRISSLGDTLVMAKLLMLWLQAFDNQPGVSIPLRDLDYKKVKCWLGRILELDPRSQYPLLAASRVYAEVHDELKQRQMLDFVYEQFFVDPDRRWRWLAHATIIAKHRLKDLPLAFAYARAITEKATGPGVPYWARDMSPIILEDMGELESARLLIGGLLDSGTITDPHEIRFLGRKLAELEEKRSEVSLGW